MELPIRVMITFFVALVVATIVIVLSQNLLQGAAEDIADISDYTSATDEDKIVDLSGQRVTSGQVANLVDQCYRQYSERALEDTLCYVVLGDVDVNPDAVISSSGLHAGKISVDVEGAENALRIYYRIIEDKVEVQP